MKQNRHKPKTQTSAAAQAAKKAPIALAFLFLFTISCTLDLRPALTVPENINASADKDDRIAVTWNEVSGITAYLVYRAQTEEGPWDTPFTTTAANRFTDLDVTPGNYYYRVASADSFDTSRHSSLSNIAAGFVLGTPVNPEWSEANTLQTGTAELLLTADYSTGDVYAAVVSEGTDSKLRVWRRTLRRGVWQEIESAPGLIAGTVGQAAVSAAGGTLFAAVCSLGADGALRIYRYDPPAADNSDNGGTWTALSSAGIENDSVTAPSIAVTPEEGETSGSGGTTGANTSSSSTSSYRIAAAAEESAGNRVFLYRYDAVSQTWTTNSSAFILHAEPRLTVSGPNQNRMRIALNPVDSADGSITGPPELYNIDINPESGFENPAAISIPTGLTEALEPASLTLAAAAEGSVTLLGGYLSSSSRISLFQYNEETDPSENSWSFNGDLNAEDTLSALPPSVGKCPGISTSGRGAAAVFFRHEESGRGQVQVYRAGSWKISSPEEFTASSGIGSMVLTEYNGRRYAGWTVSGAAQIRVYE